MSSLSRVKGHKEDTLILTAATISPVAGIRSRQLWTQVRQIIFGLLKNY